MTSTAGGLALGMCRGMQRYVEHMLSGWMHILGACRSAVIVIAAGSLDGVHAMRNEDTYNSATYVRDYS